MTPRTIKAADLFCGAGGTSTGLIEACTELGYKVELTAINHWDIAVATHTLNHPESKHLCASLDALNPRDIFKEGELDILWASPECTHHSIARGGKPINEQSRATAWCVIRWAEALRPNIILVENVKEFLTWGPTVGGKKDKQKLGKIFMSWVGNLEALGYRVDWRVMCAADHGDPTTRKRLFVQAVRGRRSIFWPEPEYAQIESTDMFETRKPWRTARNSVIDWSIVGNSIYKRKRPLAPKTMRRIMIGLEKFGLAPFVVGAGGPARAGEPITVDKPMRTVMTKNNSHLATPYLVHLRNNCDAKSVDMPTPALTAGGGHIGLAEPYLISVNHGNGKDKNGDLRRTRSVDSPLGTVTGSRGLALCKPYIIAIDHKGGNGHTCRSTDEPLTSVTTKQRHAVCQPFLIGQQSGAAPRSVDEPSPTVATAGAISLVQPYLVKFYGNEEGGHSLDVPLGTVTTKDRYGLCQPVVEIDGEQYLVDILFRMLKPKELALAQGFPADYEFTGNISQVVKQIGNAVPKNLAKAIVKAALTQRST
jgi:DNA (cytosine-5)-methyltransferase 1